MRAPDQAWEVKKINAFWKKQYLEDYLQRQEQTAEGRKRGPDSVRRSGLGHPEGRAPLQSPEQLLNR